jgi:predicted transcriptional regulator
MKNPTLLDRVRAALSTKTPKEIAAIAVIVDLHAATLARIRDGKNDPAFGKVQALAEHLKIIEAEPRKERRAKPAAAAA